MARTIATVDGQVSVSWNGPAKFACDTLSVHELFEQADAPELGQIVTPFGEATTLPRALEVGDGSGNGVGVAAGVVDTVVVGADVPPIEGTLGDTPPPPPHATTPKQTQA